MVRFLVKFVIFFVSITLPSFVLAGQNSSDNKLVIFTVENAPHVYLENDQKLSGVAHDILVSLMERTKIEFDIHVLDSKKISFKRVLKDVQNNKNHCFFVLNRTLSRENQYHWISPLMVGGWAFFKKPEVDVNISSLEDIKNYAVVGLQSNAPTGVLIKLGYTVLQVPSYAKAREMISLNRAQLMVGGRVDLPFRTARLNHSKLEIAFHWKKVELGMGCSLKSDQNLIDRLNGENQKLAGFKDEVLAKYLALVKEKGNE